MPLAPVQLDDLTWSDLTRASRDNIAAASDGQWTLHAPVDPGITLLELFAAQSEQRLFWMDHPSEETTLALLSLIEIHPRPVQLAKTVLCFHDPASRIGSDPVVPGETVMQQDIEAIGARFTTREPLWLLPVLWESVRPLRPRIELSVGGRDVTLDLLSSRAPCLFQAEGAVRRSQLVIHMDAEWATTKTDVPVSLFVELAMPPGVEPDWHSEDQDAVVPAANISWWYATRKNGHRPLEVVYDGTGGFRRSGVVRLRLPGGFSRNNPDRPANPRQLDLEIRATDVAYSVLPRVLRIVPNAVVADHRERLEFSSGVVPEQKRSANEDLAAEVREWAVLKLGGHELHLPAAAAFPIPQSVQLQLRETIHQENQPVTGLQLWWPAEHLAFAGPGDRQFLVNRELRRLTFGNGLTGRIPVPSLSGLDETPTPPLLLKLTFDVGGGPAGNIGAGTAWKSAAANPLGKTQASDALRTATNIVAAEGGAEAETRDETVRRAAAELRRRHRAVTADDIELLAESTPGVSVDRALAAVGYHPDYPCVTVPGATTVFIVPGLPRSLREPLSDSCGDDLIALQPDPGTRQAVSRRLEESRLLTQEIHVRGPSYTAIEIRVEVDGTPIHDEGIRSQISGALHRFLHAVFGGENHSGWPFGEPVRPSALQRVVQRAIGDDLHVSRVSTRLRGSTEPFEHCEDLAIGRHSLVALRKVEVTFTQSARRTGGIL